MKSQYRYLLPGRNGKVVRLAFSLSVLGCVAFLLPVPTFAGGVVTNCTEADLRAAMAGGGTVTLACDGTITLASTITNVANTRLDASGHSVTITGPCAFYVTSSSTFTVTSLQIAGCWPSGIYNDHGIVNLASVVFQGNSAGYNYMRDFASVPKGGAIYSGGGQLNATNCTFNGNHSYRTPPCCPHGPSGPAFGGAIYSEGGAMNLQQCVFTGNAVSGNLYPYHYDFGGGGSGGAVYNTGVLVADACAFVNNTISAAGGYPAPGPGLPGSAGGSAVGGAICNSGQLTVSRSLFANNSASGGPGGDGGPGYLSSGGQGGDGGSACSGISSSGSGVLVNCTFTSNTARAGMGGAGGLGTGGPNGSPGSGGSDYGAIYGDGSLSLINCSIVSNSTGVATSGSRLVNTLLAANLPGGNCLGWITDAGHNLSSDGTCNFTNIGSRNNTDPKAGPLAYNGGPTLTIALLPGSPAVDAGDAAAAPMTDQRGFPRPVGLASDIGAYEYGSPALLQATLQATNRLDLLVLGVGGQTCRLLSSTDLWSWVSIGTNQIGPDGTVHFSCDGSARRGFYRVVMP